MPLMPSSHGHSFMLSHPIRASEGDFHEMIWNEAILWQLWDECGIYRVDLNGCYGLYMVILH